MPKPAEEKPSEPCVRTMVTLTKVCKAKAVEKAYAIFGKRSGAVSMYVEMVLRLDLHLSQRGVDEI